MNAQSEKIIIQTLKEMGVEIPMVTPELRRIFKSINYIEFVRPLILKERDQANRLQIGQLAVKYGIDRQQVKYILYGQKKPQDYY